MVMLTAPQTEWVALEEDTYRAIIKSEEMVTQANRFATPDEIASGEQPEEVQKVMFTFAIDTGDATQMPTLRAWLTPSLHERATMSKLIKACGITPGENFDTAQLVGKELRVEVEQYRRADGTLGNKITAYRTMKKGKEDGSLF